LSYTPVLFVNSPGRMAGQKPGFFAEKTRCRPHPRLKTRFL